MRRLMIGVALLSMMDAASAASRVWITEFAIVKVQAAAPFATLPALIRQPVLDIAVGAKTSALFNSQTRYIRIVCEVQCAITADAVATTADILLPALKPEYFGVQGSKTISVIAAP
jgi:hypothetical protein